MSKDERRRKRRADSRGMGLCTSSCVNDEGKSQPEIVSPIDLESPPNEVNDRDAHRFHRAALAVSAAITIQKYARRRSAKNRFERRRSQLTENRTVLLKLPDEEARGRHLRTLV